MQLDYNDIFPYTARVTKEVDNGKGHWKYIVVGVFDKDGVQLGEYTHNYPSFFHTFHPFIGADGNWYALYSSNYTATRIMSLPDCKDIGGEEPDQFGFCPVDYYVPSAYRFDWLSEGKTRYAWLALDGSWKENKYREFKDEAFKEGAHLSFAPYAFLSGCIWGDDTSWKIEWLDLSQAHLGILKREARFGYVQQASSAKRLVQVISLIEWFEETTNWNHVRLKIDHTECFALKGKKFDQLETGESEF